MPFYIVSENITKMQADAIVNAANTRLAMGGGVCGAIFRAAGERELQAACDRLAPISTGEAVITPAFALPCKFVIHAVGPIYDSRKAEQSERLLSSAYAQSMALAVKSKCESIAFPLISGGIYGYPKKEALQVAVSAIREFLNDHELTVFLTLLDKDALNIERGLEADILEYTDSISNFEGAVFSKPLPRMASLAVEPQWEGEEAFKKLDEPFSALLLRLIDQKGRTDAEVYKRANIDRRLFSKIRTLKGYTPGKRTVLALAIALELNIQETSALLERAGYALSHAQKFDVMIEYFITHNKYDIFEINEVLFKYDQPLLGG